MDKVEHILSRNGKVNGDYSKEKKNGEVLKTFRRFGMSVQITKFPHRSIKDGIIKFRVGKFYKDGEVWKTTYWFTEKDLIILIDLLDEVNLWMKENGYNAC